MNKAQRWFLGILLVAGIAWAVKEQRVDKAGSAFPQWFNKGLYIGTKPTDPTVNTINKLAGVPACECDLDFPAVSAGMTVCSNSAALTSVCTCKGVQLGDPCVAGVMGTQPNDGGSGWLYGLQVEPVARGTDIVDVCVTNGADAGNLNLADAGFLIRCFTTQPIQ
jgi:hypothetical protein